MSITSIGSSFSHVPPVQAVRETAASARVEEAVQQSVDKGASDWPPKLGSEMRAERQASTAWGRLVAAQEEATSSPSIEPRDASAAYRGRG